MLECKSLSLAYKSDGEVIRIIDSVDIVVDAGGITTVYGDRLSGKYYLIRVITGLIKPTSGSVYIDGVLVNYRDEKGLNMIRRMVQTYFMDVSRSVPSGMTIKMYLDWLSREFGVKEYGWLVSEVWSRYGIEPDILGRRVYETPLHQLYIIYVSSGLLANPKYMLLENPTGLINYAYRRIIYRFITDLVDRYGVGLLITTSDKRLFKEIPGRKYILYRGRVIEEGGRDLPVNPLHPYAMDDLSVEDVSDIVDHTLVSEGLSKIFDWSSCPYMEECRYSRDECMDDIGLYRYGDRRVRCVLYRDVNSDSH